MAGIIDAFHRLQEIERGLAVIRREEDARGARVAHFDRQIAAIDRKLREAKERVRDVQRDVDAIELDVTTRETAIAKHREALGNAKTNKEYTAILTTLNTEKADASKVESAALARMADLDQLKAEVDAITEQRRGLVERRATVAAGLERYRADTADERERLETQKAEASEGIPTTSLHTFDRVARHNDGEAMAAVVKMHKRRDEYCCGGCNMHVSLEVVNTLSGGGDLQFCQVCGRILYLP